MTVAEPESGVDEPVLELRDVRVAYPRAGGLPWRPRSVQAVTGVSLRVDPGRTVGIVGESGCGKSTLAKAIVGLARPSGGQILLQGQDVAAMGASERRSVHRAVQMVFQDPYASLNPWMTVEELVSEAWQVHPGIVSRNKWSSEVQRLLELVGLRPDQRHLRPHEFSGGQRQRIGIARALAMQPKLIVCDEAVSALDVSIRAQILNLLRAIQQETGVSYLFVSHDLGVVRHVADTVAVMYLGRFVESGDTNAVFAHPSHPYTQALLSAAPSVDPPTADDPPPILLTGEVPSPLKPPSGCPFRTRCFKVQPDCADREPELERVGPHHRVACFYAEADDRYAIT